MFQEAVHHTADSGYSPTVPTASSADDAVGLAKNGSVSSAKSGASAGSIPEDQLEEPVSTKEFEILIDSLVKPFYEISQLIDPVVAEAGKLLLQAFEAQHRFLAAAVLSKKVEVSDPEFFKAIAPINEKIGSLVSLKDANRSSKFFNHLNTLAEGAPVLGWICVNTPVSFIPEFKDSAQFWSNRIVKEYKESDPKQVEWAKAFLSIFDSLQRYVKEYHTTGIAWNPHGGNLADSLKPSEPATAKAAGGPAPPPPPPPPPASVFESPEKSEPHSSGGMGAVFSQLNKGEDITSGLKKVEKSQMTHKNPSLRNAEPVSKKTSPVPPKKPNSLASQQNTKKPAKIELVDSKWFIANCEANQEPIVIDGEMQQSVFIGNCNNVTIQIKGKVNAVSLTNCTKVGIVLDSLISGIDLIKCKNFGLQIVDKVPMISVDQSDNGQIYLSSTSLSTEIYTSSTTSLNVNVPREDDLKEMPVPEQLKHTIDDKGNLKSEIVEHAG